LGPTFGAGTGGTLTVGCGSGLAAGSGR